MKRTIESGTGIEDCDFSLTPYLGWAIHTEKLWLERERQHHRQQFLDAIRPYFPNQTVEYDENGIVRVRP